jgi:hypothetical protein
LDTAAILDSPKQAVDERQIKISLHAAEEALAKEITRREIEAAMPSAELLEDLPAWVCPVCGYTVLDLEVLDSLFALDPETEEPVQQAPVFRLSLTPTA